MSLNIQVLFVKKNSKVKMVTEEARNILTTEKKNKLKIVSKHSQLSKTVVCAEILRKEFPDLYQQNFVYRESEVDSTGKNSKHLDPCFAVMFSKEPIKPSAVGFQGKESFSEFWAKKNTKLVKTESKQGDETDDWLANIVPS